MSYIYYNLNPLQRHVRDCVYRAIGYFFSISWKKAIYEMVENATDNGDVNFNYTTNIVDYMKKNGFNKYKSPKKGMSVIEFANSYAKEGHIYLIHVKKPQHMTIIDNKEILDTWDCSCKEMDYYFVRLKAA